MQKDQTWFDAMPPVEVASLSRKPTDPSRLLHILDAIRNRLEIEIDYQSMTGAPALTRSIAPHSFARSEEHTSELQSLMRISYAVFCLKNNKHIQKPHKRHTQIIE